MLMHEAIKTRLKNRYNTTPQDYLQIKVGIYNLDNDKMIIKSESINDLVNGVGVFATDVSNMNIHIDRIGRNLLVKFYPRYSIQCIGEKPNRLSNYYRNTRKDADKLAEQLTANGRKVLAVHRIEWEA